MNEAALIRHVQNGGIKEVAGIDEQSDRNRREDS